MKRYILKALLKNQQLLHDGLFMSLSLVVYEFICSTGVAEQKVLFDNGYFLNDAAAPAKKASARKKMS